MTGDASTTSIELSILKDDSKNVVYGFLGELLEWIHLIGLLLQPNERALVTNGGGSQL